MRIGLAGIWVPDGPGVGVDEAEPGGVELWPPRPGTMPPTRPPRRSGSRFSTLSEVASLSCCSGSLPAFRSYLSAGTATRLKLEAGAVVGVAAAELGVDEAAAAVGVDAAEPGADEEPPIPGMRPPAKPPRRSGSRFSVGNCVSNSLVGKAKGCTDIIPENCRVNTYLGIGGGAQHSHGRSHQNIFIEHG